MINRYDMIDKGILFSASELTVSQLRTLSSKYHATEKEQQNYQEISNRCDEKAVRILTADDHDYHFKFGQIKSAPYVVTMIGNTDLLNRQMIGIVGPRNYSAYASEVMDELFSQLSAYNLVTVSGLADGVDSIGHQLSMDNAIPTVAILGGGLRYFLRSRRRAFIQDVLEHDGLIISEFKLDMVPTHYTFPQRNRIIAGLSDLLFLPEAGKNSGSLITVDFALSMNKDVYGAPARLTDHHSNGLLHYMQQGLVKPVVEIEEMLDQYFGRKQQAVSDKQQGSGEQGLFAMEDESEVMVLLSKNPAGLTLNELVSQTGLSTEEVMSQLSMAEVLGRIKNSGEVWKS